MVVDLGTRKIDAQPLKRREAIAVLKGFKAIYKRKHLKPPTVRLEVDDGNEFKAEVKKYFIQKLKVHVRIGKPGRHRQQSLVECANKLIGQALHQRMAAQELLTGEVSREWFNDSRIMIKALDKRWQRKPSKCPEGLPKVSKDIELLPEGTKVRIALDKPRAITGEKLHGTFRASDIRWDLKIQTVKKCILTSDQPPMYLVNGPYGKLGISRAAYTRNNLQIVPENENPPSASVIRGKPERYIPGKILKSRRRKNSIQYLIKWKRFPEDQATWKPAEQIQQDLPDLVKRFKS